MSKSGNGKYVLLGLCFVVFAILFTIVGINNSSNDLTKAENQLSELLASNEEAQAKLDKAHEDYQKKLAAASVSGVGTDSDKISNEAKFLIDIIQPAYNWTSNNEYNEARGNIENQIGSDNLFMRNIMPSLEAEHLSLDEMNLKMKCMDIKVIPANNVKGKSAYYVLVEYIQYYGEDIKKQEHLTRNRQLLHVVMSSSDKMKSIESVGMEDIRVYDTGTNY